MNIKWPLLSMTIFLSFLSTPTFSLDQSTVTFKKYSSSSCSDYTGTWVGVVAEPKTAQSWPATVSLYSQKDKIVGEIDSGAKTEKSRELIWADCKNGILSNIFWGEKGDCGGYSQEGFMTDKNVMVLKLHYETMKEDTYYIAFLNKKNSDYSHPIPKEFSPGIVKTCHASYRH